MLLQHGADVSVINSEGLLAADVAKSLDIKSLIEGVYERFCDRLLLWCTGEAVIS